MKVLRYLLLSVLLGSVAFTACKKTGPADATIIVIDSTGKRIQGALVVLRQDSVVNPTNNVQASVNETGITDGSGQATFSFKLEAVLNVEASKGNLTGRDYIRLEQSKIVTKTVLIR
jgi:hypothetical protein